MRILILLAVLAFAFNVAWSRIVLGMHSYNQILFGLLLGLWLALTFFYLGYEPIMEHGIELIENKTFNGNDRKIKLFQSTAVCFGTFLFLMVIQIANYLIFRNKAPAQTQWIINITEDCGEPPNSSTAFMALALQQTGEVALGFGAYYGTVIQSYFF